MDLQTLTEAAKQWYDAGYCVLPAAADGTKRPATSWREYINGDKPRPTYDELNSMLTTGNFDGIGVIAGIASGNLEMIELEGPFEQACEALASLEKDAQAFGIKPLLDDILRGNSEITPTGGIHFFYRVKDGTPLGNTKLAQKIQPDTNGIKVIAETRGQGGWVVVQPSGGRTHPSGRAYRALDGTPATTPTITANDRDELYRLFRTLDQITVVTEPEFKQPTAPREGLSPGDDFNNRATWTEILAPAGWKSLGSSTRQGHPIEYWQRPGKNEGISATTGGPGNHLYVFSTSTNLPAEQPLSKFAVYTHQAHGGNFSTAAKQLHKDGFGKLNEPTQSFTQIEDTKPFVYTDLSWILSGNPPEIEPPIWGKRRDGLSLFYNARVNGIYGDPETAKSWLAMCTIAEALYEGSKCVYLDADHNGAVEITSRFMLLGVDRKHLANPDLFRLYEPDSTNELGLFVQEMLEWTPALAVIDSIGEILPMLGLSSVDNDDITNAIRKLLKPIAHKAGACVITIDHLPKDTEARNSGYAIGGTAKKRAIDGVYLSASVKHSVAPGRVGRIVLKVEKDRAGKVREHSPANHAGVFVLDSTNPQRIDWHIEPEEAAADGGLMPTNLMERVSHYLEEWTDTKPPSMNKIQRSIQGNDRGIARAVEMLLAEGHIAEERHGQARLFKLLKPYRQKGNETNLSHFSQPQPTLSLDTVTNTSATSATSPVKRGEAEVANPINCYVCGERMAEVLILNNETKHWGCG